MPSCRKSRGAALVGGSASEPARSSQSAECSAARARAPLWYKTIKRVEWETEPPLQRGSRIAFTAEFMRRQLRYTYEAVEYLPGQRLVMRTSGGPFPMETTYEWVDAGDG